MLQHKKSHKDKQKVVFVEHEKKEENCHGNIYKYNAQWS